jgi:predicted permease
MRSADKLRLRFRSLFLRPRVEAELAAEINFHLEQQIAENMAAGMSSREARQAALRAFGGVAQIQERCREMRGLRILDEIGQDLRYAVRTFRRSPVFTLVAALSLALGIGANTAIFSLINALLLRTLPVREPAQLVAVGDTSRTGSLSEGNVRSDLFSYPMYQRLRDQNHVFSALYASGRAGRLAVGTADGGGPSGATNSAAETASGRIVSGNFFSLLGVQAARGRTFTEQEDRAPGASPVVVISHDYWKRRFAEDPRIVGKALKLNGSPFTVIGVTPPGFTGDVVGRPTDLWVPLSMQLQVNPGRPYRDRWDTSWLLLMGRLKPGATLAQARAEMTTLFARTVEAEAKTNIPQELQPSDEMLKHVEVTRGGAGYSPFRREFSQPLFTLMAIVALVLLVACANVANLMLERAMGRQKEIAVRLSLGAGRARLLRQLLTESLLLSALGGALGIVFALWAGPALLKLAGGTSAIGLDLHPDVRILGFTAAVALLTGILFGLAPARRATRIDLAPVLKENARSVVGSGKGAGRWPLGKMLVVSQFALSLLLLMGAGLFVRSLQNLETLDLGYDRDSLVLVKLDPVGAGYQGEKLLRTFPRDIVDRLKSLPGVTAVSYSENGIFSGTESDTTVHIEGFQGTEEDGSLGVAYDRVGPEYFQSVGIPLLQGRGISGQDRTGAPLVAVVNEALMKAYFHGQSPLGKHISTTGPPAEVPYEIVGVSRDVRDHDLRGPVPPRAYLALLQSDEPASAFNVEIRTRTPAAVVQPARQAVRDYDPDMPIYGVQPVRDMIDDSISHERMIAKLSAVFGLLALLLASLGLYGVISYTIARRTNEIGIRMALGAGRRTVLWMVLRETLLLALIGVALGVPAALAAARLISSRLFGLSAYDPVTLSAATAILICVAILAGTIPGSRATRVDPTQALRYG